MAERETVRLRELACRYAEYACGEPMARRREKWRVHNRLEEKTYPFHIEDNGSYLADLTPELECEDNACRSLEGRLLRAIVAYETIDDDRIIPDRFVVDWRTPMTEVCEELAFIRADNGRGSRLGFRTNRPIGDIDADFGKLKKRTISLDREATERHAQLAEEVLGGLLPVEIGRPGTLYSNGITNKAVLLMGMQELYLQMAMNPDAVTRLFTFLAEDNMALGRWEEEQKLLTPNNDGNQGYCSGSSHYSDETASASGDRVMSSDRWGYLESQESAGVSADMFEQFLMPHFTRLAGKFKLFMFG
ncbi:MAG: hypothetical protein ACYSU0_10465, partial [Planctomycetota bacterium]